MVDEEKVDETTHGKINGSIDTLWNMIPNIPEGTKATKLKVCLNINYSFMGLFNEKTKLIVQC